MPYQVNFPALAIFPTLTLITDYFNDQSECRCQARLELRHLGMTTLGPPGDEYPPTEEVMLVLKDDKVPIGVPAPMFWRKIWSQWMKELSAFGNLHITGRNLGDG